MPAVSEEVSDARYRDECAAAGVLEQYEMLRADGNNPGFAAMLALRSPPGAKSDREFLRDTGCNRQFDKMGNASRKYILESAKKAGINISGKVFKSGLGPPSDPLAWVRDRGDVLKTAKIKNLNIEGDVNYVAEDRPPPKKKLLADDIVRNEVLKMTAENPDLAAKCRKNPKLVGELKEKVIEKHVPERRRKRIEG